MTMRLHAIHLFLPVLVTAVTHAHATSPRTASPPAVSAELAAHRKQMIQDFQRTGLNTTPGDALFLRVVVESTRVTRGVEVGTATGYGAMLMGLAFERNGGHLTTIDIDPKMVAAARQNIAAMQLKETVTVLEGDALEVIPRLEGQYDFVFLDAVKSDYLKYFRAIEPKLAPGSVIVADNVIRSADAMQDFLAQSKTTPNTAWPSCVPRTRKAMAWR